MPLAATDSVLTDGQHGETPLHSACYKTDNCCELAEILIAAGADVNAKAKVTVPCMPLIAADKVLVDGQGTTGDETPLDRAKHYKLQDMTKLLEAAGARYCQFARYRY